MKTDILEIKLRQYMTPGMPYYSKQIVIGIGMELIWKSETLERKIRDVDAIYYKRKGKYKHYYIDSLPDEPCIFSKHYDKAMKLLAAGKERLTWVR